MKRRHYLKTSTLLAGAALACGWRPETSFGFEAPRTGDLESALKILNLWEKQPEPVTKLYSAIYHALATSPQATYATVAADATMQALCKEQGITHFGGPMLGCIAPDGAKVWLRTTRPAKVEVKAKVDGREQTFGPVQSTLESDLTAIVPVTGLKPGTVTPYRVLVDGKEIAIPAHAAITTPTEDPSARTCITFGTCQHRWGIAHRENTREIMKRKPVAMLMYGDVAVQDRNNDLGMHRADYALRDFHPTWQNLVCSTPVYTSWDDHDYFDNDRWGIPKKYTDKDRRGVRKVWTQAWNNPYYGLGEEGGGIFNHTRIGPCDIIMTDNRYFRSKGGKDCFLGPEQMAWLKKTLLACKGPFIILSSGTMWSDYVSGGKDSWGAFDPEGREEIFSLIEMHRIPGVLLISGDRHGARGFRIPRPSGHEFYEFEPASLGGRTGPAATSPKWDTQLYGFSGKFAFGEFTFDVSKDDPTVTYKLIEANGKALYELTLKRSQAHPGMSMVRTGSVWSGSWNPSIGKYSWVSNAATAIRPSRTLHACERYPLSDRNHLMGTYRNRIQSKPNIPMRNRSRREFISSMALALPGGMWAVETHASPAVWRPKQALSSVMFSELSLEDFCALAAKLGFKWIDLWGPFGKCRHMAEAVQLGADGFGKLLQRHGLQVGAWTTYRTNGHNEGFPGFAGFIGACGGGIVVRESSYGGAEKHKLEESFRRFFGELKPEIELARKHKVRLAIENHSDAILDTPESFEIFRRLNPAPDVVGMGVAPYHLQNRKADVASVIRTAGDQLLFFYAWQLAGGKGQLPGAGPADFAPWMQALADAGYRYWMTPFMHGDLPADEMATAVAKAKQYLNTLKLQP